MPTGRVFSIIDVKTTRLFKYWRQYDTFRFAVEIIVVVYLVYFFREEWKAYREEASFWKYLTSSAFRMLDAVNLLLFAVQVC